MNNYLDLKIRPITSSEISLVHQKEPLILAVFEFLQGFNCYGTATFELVNYNECFYAVQIMRKDSANNEFIRIKQDSKTGIYIRMYSVDPDVIDKSNKCCNIQLNSPDSLLILQEKLHDIFGIVFSRKRVNDRTVVEDQN